MHKKLLIIVALLHLSSCGCPYYVRRTCAASRSDSTRVEIRERIVIDTAIVEVEREVERIVTRDTASHLENQWAQSDAVVSDGLLSHSLESKPRIVRVPVEVVVRDTVIVEHEARIITKEVEKKLTAWQSFRLNAFWYLLAIIILYIAIKLILKKI